MYIVFNLNNLYLYIDLYSYIYIWTIVIIIISLFKEGKHNEHSPIFLEALIFVPIWCFDHISTMVAIIFNFSI